jgi:ADP-ribosyl-[dinitrogen reductase] hydrolase
MDKSVYDFVQPQDIKGKIFLTCFPGRKGAEILYKDSIFLTDMDNFIHLGCNTILSLVEDSEFEKLCDKKNFVRTIYSKNLKWMHMPIEDLKAPDRQFNEKWQTTKVLLKNDLIEGKNIVVHCMGGKGRSGTIVAILLIEFGEDNKKAMEEVRKKRTGAIETKEQEEFILNYNSIK